MVWNGLGHLLHGGTAKISSSGHNDTIGFGHRAARIFYAQQNGDRVCVFAAIRISANATKLANYACDILFGVCDLVS